ncbi:tyrosine-type recombinase/integrase [Lysinibacillus capsici]|uniref:tyrosine-type recombinase/integrase n=1 Tax=Lysinibacillus capsici TaxID=2115968 RepID=UPI0030821F98|nr:tyrosine-type recombinase/integrase [Lysinibacillus capsici]
MNNTITVKSTLEEAYLDQELDSVWSQNSKNVYRRNIKKISEHMTGLGLEPTIENVTTRYCKKWLKDHYGNYQPSTLNQQKSTMTSLFRHLKNDGIVTNNPFLNVTIEDYSGDTYLSKDLNIIELYQVYKAAHELQADGINILAPMLLDIYTGLRSTNLIKLKVKSLVTEECSINITLDKEDTGDNQEDRETPIINSKNREGVLPIPPKAMAVLREYAKGKSPEDPLLYGLKGKAFANKQMNYIVKKICEHLGWLVEMPVSDGSNVKKKIKTNKYFTPHGLRYSIAGIFHDFGVEDNSIRMLLLHSKKQSLGPLSRYIFRSSREYKQLCAAQILLETVLETALEMEDRFGVLMDLDSIYEQLPNAYENLLKNPSYIIVFKDQLIRFTFSKMEDTMLSNLSTYSTNYFTSPAEGNIETSPFQFARVNPNAYRQQVGYHQEGFTTPSTNMNQQYQTQSMTNHFQPNYPTHLNGYDIFNKR